jgi:predicted P-loop ATPase
MGISTKVSVKPLSLAYLFYLEKFIVPCLEVITLEAWEKPQAAFLLVDIKSLGVDLLLLENQIKASSLEMFLSDVFPAEDIGEKNPKKVLNQVEEQVYAMNFRYVVQEDVLRLFLEELSNFGCTQYEFKDIAKRALQFCSKYIDPKQFEFNAIIPLSKELNKPKKLKEVKTSTPIKPVEGWDDKDDATNPEKGTVRDTPRYYGGTKPLAANELLELVEDLGDRLTFDNLTSTLILDGERLTIGKDVKFWFLKTFGETARKDDITDCITFVAKQRGFNPLQEYLESLDCEPIPINDLAKRYLNKDELIYSRMMEMWLISAVARALTPLQGIRVKGRLKKGTKVDYTLVLQSDQGKYKSTFFDVIGGEWFSDSVRDIESKDSLMIAHSAWIVELSELDRITSKKKAGSFKHWLTQKCDSYRKPYMPEVDQNLPRRCVFCATVNPSKFLVDDENRRFWVVPVPEGKKIDVELLESERDGIWLSALLAYQQGVKWWPTDEEEIEIAKLNTAFREIDAWEDEVNNFIKEREYISSYEILVDLFKFEPANIKDADSKRVMRILTNLGWKKDSRKEYTTDTGVKITRNVKLNPFIKNNLDGKGGKGSKEASTQDFQETEAGKNGRYGGKSDPGLPPLPPKIETFLLFEENDAQKAQRKEHLSSISYWVNYLNWTIDDLKAYSQHLIGVSESNKMPIDQLAKLVDALSQETKLKPKEFIF